MSDIIDTIGKALRVDAWALYHSPSGTWSYVGPYSKDDFVGQPSMGYRAEPLTRIDTLVKALADAGYVIVKKERPAELERAARALSPQERANATE